MKLHRNVMAAVLIGSAGFSAGSFAGTSAGPSAASSAGPSATSQAHDHRAHSARSMAVQAFNEDTWAKLRKTGPKPAAYLFTTTYCSACPAVFQEVRDAAGKSKSNNERKNKSRVSPELIVVMMDAEGPDALRHVAHFRGMTQLFSFDGYEPAIRSTIDPAWRNITPYVVLVDRHGGIQTGIGSPTPQSLKRWLE